ncbi:DUF6928 family protein [Kitasatospora sp. NPDC001540]|uniref:DUF6928 family protein n=1 Tax=Kitasatospora sp. NPDC001540 TaxID=3364014 RepID=UPI0036BBA08B
MGFRTSLLVYADGEVADCLRGAGTADPGRTTAMLRRLTPGRTLEPTAPVGLWQGTAPAFGDVCAASFPAADLVCDQRLVSEQPSTLPAGLVAASAGRRLVMHAMDSVVDRFAFAVWEDGRLVRSLSLCPDDGFIEDLGERLPFEAPYWEADRNAATVPWPERAEDPAALPFHALALGVSALRALCGLVLDGPPGPDDVDGTAIGLHGFTARGPIGP